MIKECVNHGLTDFVARQGGKRWRCKKCAVDVVTKRRRKVKIMAVEYMGGQCSKCGYDKYPGAMDFHHLNADQKEFAISGSGLTRSWEKIKKELDKCVLLCSNCHRELHGDI